MAPSVRIGCAHVGFRPLFAKLSQETVDFLLANPEVLTEVLRS